MSSATRARFAVVEMWLSGALFGLGVAMLVSGFVLGAIYFPLSVMFAVLSAQNRQLASRTRE